MSDSTPKPLADPAESEIADQAIVAGTRSATSVATGTPSATGTPVATGAPHAAEPYFQITFHGLLPSLIASLVIQPLQPLFDRLNGQLGDAVDVLAAHIFDGEARGFLDSAVRDHARTMSRALGQFFPSILPAYAFLLLSALAFVGRVAFAADIRRTIAGMLLGAAIVLLVIALRLFWQGYKQVLRSISHAVIVIETVTLLGDMVAHPDQWRDMEARGRWIRRMDYIANRIEPVAWLVMCPDRAQAAWTARSFAEIAAAFRAHQRWLVTPKPDTRQHLIEYLRDFLRSVIYGDWDSLERTPREAPPGPASWRAAVARGARTIVIAALPPAGLALFLWLQPRVEIPPFVYAAAIAWPILIVLAAIDPDIKTKIGMFKDATQLLPSAAKEKKE